MEWFVTRKGEEGWTGGGEGGRWGLAMQGNTEEWLSVPTAHSVQWPDSLEPTADGTEGDPGGMEGWISSSTGMSGRKES